jgi:hypothetical protein
LIYRFLCVGRELGIDADAPDDFDEGEYDKAGQHVRERVRAMLPQIKRMKEVSDKMGHGEFLKEFGKDLGLDVSVPEGRPRGEAGGDKRWWVSLPEVQVRVQGFEFTRSYVIWNLVMPGCCCVKVWNR